MITGKSIIDYIVPYYTMKVPTRKAKDYTGYRKGRLTVIGEVPPQKRKNKAKRELICLCECGDIRSYMIGNITHGNTNSCGCLGRELYHENKINYYIGRRFERLVGVREADDSKPSHIRILCRCDCGNYKSVSAGDLRSGMVRSCGCLKTEVTKRLWTEDLTGQTFYELTAIRQVENFVGSTGVQRVQWLWRCSCGNEVVALAANVKHGKTKSCGHLTKSYAEQQIYNHLKELGIEFEYDKAFFSDLSAPDTIHPVRFDFIIQKSDKSYILIEHQGLQHFRERNGYYEEFGKRQREITDKLKRERCKQENIPLYETLYNEDYIAHIDAILKENGFLIAS